MEKNMILPGKQTLLPIAQEMLGRRVAQVEESIQHNMKDYDASIKVTKECYDRLLKDKEDLTNLLTEQNLIAKMNA